MRECHTDYCSVRAKHYEQGNEEDNEDAQQVKQFVKVEATGTFECWNSRENGRDSAAVFPAENSGRAPKCRETHCKSKRHLSSALCD